MQLTCSIKAPASQKPPTFSVRFLPAYFVFQIVVVQYILMWGSQGGIPDQSHWFVRRSRNQDRSFDHSTRFDECAELRVHMSSLFHPTRGSSLHDEELDKKSSDFLLPLAENGLATLVGSTYSIMQGHIHTPRRKSEG